MIHGAKGKNPKKKNPKTLTLVLEVMEKMVVGGSGTFRVSTVKKGRGRFGIWFSYFLTVGVLGLLGAEMADFKRDG